MDQVCDILQGSCIGVTDLLLGELEVILKLLLLAHEARAPGIRIPALRCRRCCSLRCRRLLHGMAIPEPRHACSAKPSLIRCSAIAIERLASRMLAGVAS